MHVPGCDRFDEEPEISVFRASFNPLEDTLITGNLCLFIFTIILYIFMYYIIYIEEKITGIPVILPVIQGGFPLA